MKQIFLFMTIAIIGVGLYLKFFYDVPDSQAAINFFTSWFFVIVGTAGLLVNIFWTSKPKHKDSDK